MRLLLEIFWFLLPSGCANMAPIFASRLFPKWTAPLDGEKTLRGIRIFGAHKTLRGFGAGILVSTAVYWIQSLAYTNFHAIRDISVLDYHETSFLLGTLFGVGALGGDLVKSFFKRQIGIEPGQSWIPFDQIDWMAGTLLVVTPFIHLQISFIVMALVLALVLSCLFKWLGYLVRMNKAPI